MNNLVFTRGILIKISYVAAIFLVSMGSLVGQILEEQKNQEEEQADVSFDLSNIPYFTNDLFLVAGLNYGGLYWSNYFKELRSAGGFSLGVEGYTPMGNMTFINYGLHFAQRNFIHGRQEILFSNNYLDMPIYVSFRLPEFQNIDFRFFLGTQFSYRLGSNQQSPYLPGNLDAFEFDTDRFNRFDTGMNFGLSGETGRVFFRLRSFVGISKLDRMEQAPLSAFFIEGGYFLFRNYGR